MIAVLKHELRLYFHSLIRRLFAGLCRDRRHAVQHPGGSEQF